MMANFGRMARVIDPVASVGGLLKFKQAINSNNPQRCTTDSPIRDSGEEEEDQIVIKVHKRS